MGERRSALTTADRIGPAIGGLEAPHEALPRAKDPAAALAMIGLAAAPPRNSRLSQF